MSKLSRMTNRSVSPSPSTSPPSMSMAIGLTVGSSVVVASTRLQLAPRSRVSQMRPSSVPTHSVGGSCGDSAIEVIVQ